MPLLVHTMPDCKYDIGCYALSISSHAYRLVPIEYLEVIEYYFGELFYFGEFSSINSHAYRLVPMIEHVDVTEYYFGEF